jgi:hypothetical protein
MAVLDDATGVLGRIAYAWPDITRGGSVNA